MVTGVCTAPYIKYERDYADYTPQKIQETKVIQISDPLGFSEAIKSPKLTIVNFYQSSFNPCKYFNPKFAKLAADMSQYARFVQVDCEYPRMQKWASESEEIRVFPSFKFYLNGRELLHIIGTNEIRMRGLIKQHAVQNQDIATKKVRDLRTVAEFNQLINQTDKLVVVSYYSKKCLICDRAQPILEDVGTQFYRDAEFAMIDVDKPQFKSLCLEQDVTGTPCIRLYLGSRKVAAFAGICGYEMRKMIEKFKVQEVEELTGSAKDRNPNVDVLGEEDMKDLEEQKD